MKFNTGGKKWIAGSFMALTIAIAGALTAYYEPAPHNANVAYWDAPGQRWTICDGHTKDVHAGEVVSDAQCAAWKQEDLTIAYKAVDRCITAALTVTQAAAFADAALNEGPKVVCGSTLQRLANAGHVVEACHQLPRWIWAGGEKSNGLKNRRDDETDLCTEGLK